MFIRSGEDRLATAKNAKLLITGIVAIAVAIIIGGTIYYWQQTKIKALANEKASVETERDAAKEILEKDQKTIDALMEQIDDITAQSEQMAMKLAEQLSTKETSIATANAISWTSGNNAKVSLTRVRLSGTGTTKKLDLFFDVTTTDGGYCWQSMDTYLRITDEKGTYVNPDKVAENCASGYSTMKDQKVSFPVSDSQKIVDIYNRGRDARGDTAMKKLFSIYDDNFRVVGYPQ